MEVTRAYLARIDRLDPFLRTYITVTPDLALQAAGDAEARHMRHVARGPLDGVPIGVKDLIDTREARTTGASLVFVDRRPKTDATVVRHLLSAGAVLLGKHSLHEFGSGGPLQAGVFPAARNPWDLTRGPGGSSSGSAAAVAAGLCAGALGTDTAGSIRSPASLCGIVGFKPSYGLVACKGVIPLSPSLDHCGPLARTVEDAAILLDTVADRGHRKRAGGTFGSALRRGVAGTRIGLPSGYLAEQDVAPAVLGAFHGAVATLESLGAVVTTVDLPAPKRVVAAGWVILSYEAFQFHKRSFADRSPSYGPRFGNLLRAASELTREEYEVARRERQENSSSILAAMRSVDVMVMPTTLGTAPELASEVARDHPRPDTAALSFLFDLTGQPAISVPCALSPEGLPIGLQIAGRMFEDAFVLGVAHAYEQAVELFRQVPRLP